MPPTLDSRARYARSLSDATAGVMFCAGCAELINPVWWRGTTTTPFLIANIYAGRGRARRWVRLEHWHVEHYLAAGSPYGEPEPMPAKPRRAYAKGRLRSW